MATLYLHNRKLESIFELLGAHENDITYSIGWALAQSPTFLRAFLRGVGTKSVRDEAPVIRLQEQKTHHGITDIEIVGQSVHVIAEAKRGWTLPSTRQLRRYAKRFRRGRGKQSKLAVMAECSDEFAARHLPKTIGGFPVVYLSWKEVGRLAAGNGGTHAEKHLLRELRTYLRRLGKMQDQESNWVYVVALGSGIPKWSKISWRDFVEKKRRYFHPFGKGWPKELPNYLAFRYRGRLQSIHHVESAEVVEELRTRIPEVSLGKEPLVLYRLGKPIRPTHCVKTGKLYPNGRVWAMLDLLLTCKSISDARDKTKKRQAKER